MLALSIVFLALTFTAHTSPAPSTILSRQSLCANDTEIQDFILAATDPSTGASQPVAVDFTAILAVCLKLRTWSTRTNYPYTTEIQTTSFMTGAPFNSNFTLTDTFLFTGAFPTAQLGAEATAGNPITFEAFSLGAPPARALWNIFLRGTQSRQNSLYIHRFAK